MDDVVIFMADFKYLEKQEKKIEKKREQLDDKTRILLLDSKIKKYKEKYKELEKKKKSDSLDYEDEILMDIYQDAIKNEEKKR